MPDPGPVGLGRRLVSGEVVVTMIRPAWRDAKITLKRDPDTGDWVLRRGEIRVASSDEWADLVTVLRRIVDREERIARREAFISR